jgi:hypothetical protein
MTKRIEVSVQLHAQHVFSGSVVDELTNEQLVTRTRISHVTYQRFVISKLAGVINTIETKIDSSPVTIPATEYVLYDIVQTGLPYSTDNKPYTWAWLIPEPRTPFFPSTGKYCVEIVFYPRNVEEPNLKLVFYVTVL